MQVKDERQATYRRSESLSVSYRVQWDLAAPWCSRHWAPPLPFDNKPKLDLFEFFQRGQIV
jgi:hypothetical protein